MKNMLEKNNGWIAPGESSGGGIGCIEGWDGLIDGGTRFVDGGTSY